MKALLGPAHPREYHAVRTPHDAHGGVELSLREMRGSERLSTELFPLRASLAPLVAVLELVRVEALLPYLMRGARLHSQGRVRRSDDARPTSLEVDEQCRLCGAVPAGFREAWPFSEKPSVRR